ncbi:carbohydrate binding domain-containing protein [Paenibacillus hodogayensis]|uniref:Carbohydrate binding domain-containing protein n=1 Tax=Paenibacillus hodogayensis TaxID=279208 RepID=A0ABV5W4B6_9BACL
MSKRMRSCIAIVLAALLLLNIAPSLAKTSYALPLVNNYETALLNGGFEEVTGNMPDHWTYVNGAELSTEKAHSGTYSVKLNDPSPVLSAAVRSNKIAVVPGQRYDTSVFSYNVQGISELYLEFWDANNNYKQILTGANRTLNQWSKIAVSGVAPEGTAYATLRFYLHGANVGSAYFDDAVVEHWVAPVPGLLNGGFEEITANMPDHWTFLNGAELSTERARSGTHSVKLNDPSDVLSAAARSNKIAVVPGQRYDTSVFSYNVQGISELYLEFWDSNDNYKQILTGANRTLNQWSKIAVSGVAPAGTAYATLRFYLNGANVGSAYFDDAAVELWEAPEPGLLNGGFEEITANMPNHWTYVDGAELSTEKARSGTYSVKLNDPSDALSAAVRSNKIAVVPGQKYEASVFSYNVQGISELYLEFWDGNKNYKQILTGANRTLNQWSKITVSGVVPEGTAYATLRLYLNGANVGSAYFDDAAFKVVVPLLEPSANLNNGGFELSVQGKPRYWSEVDGTIIHTSERVRGGGSSVKIAYAGTGASPGLRSHKLPVVPGQTYEASVYSYATQGKSALYEEYWDAEGVLITSIATKGNTFNQWEQLTVSHAAPGNAAFATLRLAMDSGQAGTAFFDDAAFLYAGAATNAKTRATFYTPAKVAAARLNVQTYNWAKTLRNDAVAKADLYLSKGLDFLWAAVPAQTLPRSYGVNQTLGSPITGKEIDKFGNYPYQANPLNAPWKIVDPSSGYTFPTNDFGAYYRSGLDEHAIFRPELADRSLLVNTLYPQKGPTWGVDDGFGWIDDNGKRYTFIAYYVHWFEWYASGLIHDGLRSLRDAYLYTGDIRYARAGTVLLDRVADIYPEMDTMLHDQTIFLNSHGGTGLGKAVGSIWETDLVKDLITAYDAFFPAMDDPELVQFLDAKAVQYKLTNGKGSGAAIRRNIENGIVKQVFPAVKAAQIRGNDGMHQSALAVAAVVYDTLPATKEWLDFTFQTGEFERNPYKVTGGNLLNTLMGTINRDGSGNEASPEYNDYWLSTFQMTANVLKGYDLYPAADLYQNVKFRKMFAGTYPLVLSEKYTANIGDTLFTGNPGILPKMADMVRAFDEFGEPIYAQLAYFLNNNQVDGIHKDVFSANPNEIADSIRNVISQFGPLNLKSDNLTGYGFSALRDGISANRSFGLPYAFPPMEIASQNTEVKRFDSSGTLQLEAANIGARITFNFNVLNADDYEIDLLPFRAPSYGIYRVSIDGEPITDMDFFGSRTDDYERIGRKQLSAGTHQISFEGIGKHPSSSNFKMGIRSFNLLNEEARLLRDNSGTPEDTLRDTWMYYGINYGHGHSDTLNLGLHAFKLDLSPDLGYPEFADVTDMHRAQWVMNTISHNTVMVDKKKQAAQLVANPQHFDDSGMVKLIDVEAPKVYPQTELYKRTTAMIKIDDANSYTVDFFRVKGGNDHYFSFHGAEGVAQASGLSLVVQPTGTYAGPDVAYGQRVDDIEGAGYRGSGFHYLKNVSRDTNPGDQFSIDWKVVDTWKVLPTPADIHLRLTMLTSVNDVALADGVPPQNKPGNPKSLRYLIAHRSGTNLDSLFTSVIEPYQTNRKIDTIQPAVVKTGGSVASGNKVKAVKVTLANGRTDYIVNALNPEITYTVDDKFKFKGFMGVYSEQNGIPVYQYVHDGSFIVPIDAVAGSVPGALQGTVVDFTKVPSLHNEITVQLSAPGMNTAGWVGRTIVIANDGVRNAAYRIKGATDIGNGKYRLDLGDITLIRSFVDAYDFSKGYVYDIAEGASFRVPLTHIEYPLTTVASVAGEQGQGGWYTGPATVALQVYGSPGSVTSTVYSLNGGSSWAGYTAPIVLNDSGLHVLQYRSTEGGKVEPTKMITVNIDRTPPTFVLLANGAPLAAESAMGHTQTVALTLHAEDAVSGVAQQSILVDGVPYTSGTTIDWSGHIGSHTVVVSVADQAGNRKEAAYVIHVTGS